MPRCEGHGCERLHMITQLHYRLQTNIKTMMNTFRVDVDKKKIPHLRGVCVCVCLTDRVSGRLLALLVLAIVTCDCAVSSFSLHCASIRTHQHTGHHAQRAVT